MISPELLGRARGALAAMEPTAPGAVVLRELIEQIEAVRAPGPALVYLPDARAVLLTGPQDLPTDRLQLHLIRALLAYATERVEAALPLSKPSS